MTAATSRRRNYTEAFKRDAVALVTEQGYKVSEAARSLGINSNQLGRWKQAFAAEVSGARLSADEREERQAFAQRGAQSAHGKRDFKKSEPVLREGNEMKYGFVREHAGHYPVNRLCRLLAVQRSAYYDWRDRPGKVIAPEELTLRRRMQALFAASRGSLGSRTMMNNLREEGFEIGRERTRRLMKTLKLTVRQKRRYRATTDSNHSLPVAENVLNRAFCPPAPNQVWGTDITYLWTQQGWIYLAVVIDLYSRRVVGWSIDRRLKKALVIRALLMAINLRKPPPGLIHHSDRGSQYASHHYQALLAQHGMACSMSRKGNCWDNAPVERFFSSLKREWTGNRLYRTRQEAMADVREYVAVYYNAKRLHSTLGYTTPMDYEKVLNKVSGSS